MWQLRCKAVLRVEGMGGGRERDSLLGCYFLFSLTPDCLEGVSSSSWFSPTLHSPPHPQPLRGVNKLHADFLPEKLFLLSDLKGESWQDGIGNDGKLLLSWILMAGCVPVDWRGTMAYPEKSHLRRSFSEHIRVSTNKAWDIFWKSAREKRLSGQLPEALLFYKVPMQGKSCFA